MQRNKVQSTKVGEILYEIILNGNWTIISITKMFLDINKNITVKPMPIHSSLRPKSKIKKLI